MYVVELFFVNGLLALDILSVCIFSSTAKSSDGETSFAWIVFVFGVK